ncbi:MAG: preprotein translocase subunit SecG [Jannaschia sp.]
METVLLLVHLIIAVCLIAIVLLQRSEGGGLGMGGGGGAMSGRAAATAMTKLTWLFGIVFLVNAIVLTVLSAQNAGVSSVVDRTPVEESAPENAPLAPPGESLLPPSTGDAPLTPPRSE